MEDNGVLRSPKWLRSWSEEYRLKHARVPRTFRHFLDGTEASPPGAVEFLESYERGALVLVPGRNGVYSARKAAWLLGALVRLGESARWIAADKYIEMYKDEWDDNTEGALWRELKYMARGYDVLVIDGLGEEPNTEFERKILASLIRHRVENELTTVVATPLNTVELAAYGGRIGHYFEEEGVTVGR